MALSSKRRFAALTGVVAVALTATACGGSSEDGGSDGTSSGSTSTIDCAPYKTFGDLKGKTVTVYTSITAPEDGPHQASYKPFEACTGVTIKYEGSKEFEAQLPVRVKGGNAPDIAYLPQPGLLKTMVETGKVKPAPAEVTANVDKNMPDFKEYGTVDGTFYAAPLGANVKSFVWYSPQAFKDKGYEIPKTWDALLALSDKIVADNPGDDVKPWCAGIESGDATGWTATDWVEDVMLRTAGAETYDKWVKHEIPFNDPAVATALAEVGKILKNPKYVNGGYGDVKTIASTSFQDGGQPILEGSCYMHRQASFYAANWPEGTKVAEDGDVWAFYLPAKTEADHPVLGGGEFVAAFTDRPEVKAFQTYLASVEWANERAKTCGSGGCVTANKNADPALLTNPVDKLSAVQLTDKGATFRFDASDLMPGAVGSGTFWKGMTNWITGQDDKATLDFIENSWPK
ncbi:ABC transporter substrate-binding protein [Oryzobacter telluris]|uniref:ABC transporter substrate-binding protein n=1 Tax=Oryzobacter telluris TaxID=3149179 RepID=UPI00370DA0B9